MNALRHIERPLPHRASSIAARHASELRLPIKSVIKEAYSAMLFAAAPSLWGPPLIGLLIQAFLLAVALGLFRQIPPPGAPPRHVGWMMVLAFCAGMILIMSVSVDGIYWIVHAWLFCIATLAMSIFCRLFSIGPLPVKNILVLAFLAVMIFEVLFGLRLRGALEIARRAERSRVEQSRQEKVDRSPADPDQSALPPQSLPRD